MIEVDAKINKIQVRGEIPYLLLLEDTISENNELLYGSDFINIMLPCKTMYVRLFTKKIISSAQKNNDIIVASEDFYGELTRTQFCLEFIEENMVDGYKGKFHEILLDESWNIDSEKIFTETTEAINKLLRIYRATDQGKYFVQPINKSKISPISITVYNNEQIISGPFVMSRKGTGIMMEVVLEKEKLDYLKKYTTTLTYEVDRCVEFLQNANYYKATAEYDKFVIFLASYFESWVFREIKFKLEREGKNKDEIDLYIQVCKYPNDILKKYCGDTRSKEIIESKEYKKYFEVVNNARNDIIHYRVEKTYISEMEAEIMIQIVKDCTEYILSKL